VASVCFRPTKIQRGRDVSRPYELNILWLLLLLIAACAPVAASAPENPAYITQTPRLLNGMVATQIPQTINTPNPLVTQPTLPTMDSIALTPTLRADGSEIIGMSVEGRAITAIRFGTGTRIVTLIGGIHGGWEANTVMLMEALTAHFRDNPEDIPVQTSIVIIPAANPDGLIRGRTPEGRFNANGVDLNRNWSCEWSPDARWRDQAVNPGRAPMSEPETQALAAYLLRTRPAAALFFHSAANGVFAGGCDGDHGSALLARVFGEAAPYPFESEFTAYPVTGTEAEWADGQGIPAADVELINATDMDFERNLRGVIAVLEWLAEG